MYVRDKNWNYTNEKIYYLDTSKNQIRMPGDERLYDDVFRTSDINDIVNYFKAKDAKYEEKVKSIS